MRRLALQELINFPKPALPDEISKRLQASIAQNAASLPSSTPNPATQDSTPLDGDGELRRSRAVGELDAARVSPARRQVPLEQRYYANYDGVEWPPQIDHYNESFTKCLETIKRRHDPVVTTIGEP